MCNQERIPGAIKIDTSWAIPADAEKPKDKRIKTGKYIKGKIVLGEYKNGGYDHN